MRRPLTGDALCRGGSRTAPTRPRVFVAGDGRIGPRFRCEAVQVVRADGLVGQVVEVTVELFGRARMATGRRAVTIALASPAHTADFAAALHKSCPELAGLAVREDGSGLLESYTLNVNGTTFVGEDGVQLVSGDTVLLFSSQAGG